MQPTKTTVRLNRFFQFILSKRFWVVGFFALISIPAVYFAIQIKQDNAPERLVVQDDPDVKKNAQFETLFGKNDPIILFLDTPSPFAPDVLSRAQALQKDIRALQGVLDVVSILSLFSQSNAVRPALTMATGPQDPSIPIEDRVDFLKNPEYAERLQHFALPSQNGDPRMRGTDLFVRQGLVMPGKFLGLQILLDKQSSDARHALLAKIDAALSKAQKTPGSALGIRKVGQAYVNDYLDRDTRKAGLWGFGLFGLFIVVLNWFLYRSVRTLLAFLLPLLVSTVLTVGFIVLIKGTFTIVSSLIPMTILVTCLATLVYIQSRFVEKPEGVTTDEHQIFSLTNKFLACTASIFATAVGFAALLVSKIRPIREMGLWVAVGLVFTWVVVFTLFPALQKILKTPTQQERKVAGQWFIKLIDRLPRFSYRFRWPLVIIAVLWTGLGVVALFGIPGLFPKMTLETSAIEYINHNSALYKDTKQLEQQGQGGLFNAEIWLQTKKPGAVLDFATIVALKDLSQSLESPFQGHRASIVDFPMLIRTSLYLQIGIDALPQTEADWEKLTDLLEQQSARSPMLRNALSTYTNVPNYNQVRLSLYTKTLSYDAHLAFVKWIEERFAATQKQHPVLSAFSLQVVGSGPLQAKISHHLVPTLTESFIITIVIIFGTFLVVFRSGAARIMALIPSLFAILAMFSIMRVVGMSLNIATILIASTVLGTSENDQIHFFYHYQEKKKAGGSTEASLRHTFLVAGRAIFFATLINATGFLAFAFSGLPPIRQFGLLSSLAFVLSMIADFTALPAALWLVFRQKPDAEKTA